MAPPQGKEKDVEKRGGLTDTQNRAEEISTAQRILIVAAVCFAQFLGLFDQTAVNTAVPSIAEKLHIGASISWVACSFLASSTATQLVIGRLSDIFGRKATIIGSLCLVMFGELMNSFAKNQIWLYACRAVAGFGAGSLGSQTQIVVTDVTTMKQRGNYFGIIGVAVALGNGLGPVFGGLLAQNVNPLAVFWIVPPMCALAIIILIFTLPGSGRKENTLQRLKLVDWFGVFMTLAGTFLILVPINEGGSTFAYDSSTFIALLTIGIVIFIVLIIAEWKFIKLPVLAVYLFGQGWGINTYLWQNAGIGWVWFGNFYFIPQWLQNVRGFSPAYAGCLLLPMVLTNGVTSALSGYLVSRSGHYLWSLYVGTSLWLIGLACQAAFFNRHTSIVAIALIGIVQGAGIGFVMQPNLVGILAHTYRRDRAVATALRQFIRSLMGAIGIAASNAILSSSLRSGLTGVIPDDLISGLTSSTADLTKLGLSEAQQQAVRNSYMNGIHIIFIIYAPFMAAMLLAMIPLRDHGLKQLDEIEKEKENAKAGVEPAVPTETADGEKQETTIEEKDSKKSLESREAEPEKTVMTSGEEERGNLESVNKETA